MDSWLVGRDAVLEQADRVLAGSGAVLLEGPAGIGKTALWQALRSAAEKAGALVLSAAPAEFERLLPYSALADLLRPLSDLIAELPTPQRIAAEVVLVSAEDGDAFDERAVGAATRSLLDAAIARAHPGPVLIAIDDAPWLDQPSERALGFALRRLTSRPAVLLAARTDGGDGADPADIPLGLERSDPPVVRFPLTPLGVGALHHVLRTRLDVTFSRPLLNRIATDSGGNPLLAIELARAVLRLPALPRPGEDLPVGASVQQLLAARVDALPEQTRSAVRLASLLTSPSLADLAAAGVSPETLEPAEEAGLLVVGPSTVRFGHPTHAAAVRAAIPPGVRRRLQRNLADAVANPDERARQLARSTVDPDAAVALELEQAARRQRARGAPDLAAELFDRAAALTPEDHTLDRSRRLLAAVRCRFDSGDHTAAETSAAAADRLLTGDPRAEALLLRATIAFVTQGHLPAVAFANEALGTVSPDSMMAGRIHAYLAVFQDRPEAAIRHGEAALALLDDRPPDRPPTDDRWMPEDEHDGELLCSVLLMLFFSEVRAGRPPRLDRLDRALALEGEVPPWLGGTIPAIWWSAVDEHDRAAERMERHLAHAVSHGDEPLQLEVLLHLVQSEIFAGRWDGAAEHLVLACALGEQLGTGMAEENLMLSQLAVYRGELDTVGPVVEAGLRRAQQAGDSWGRRVYGGLAGQIALARGHFAEAATIFGALAEDLDAQGLAEPLANRPEPDWIEACVGVGDLDTARLALHTLLVRHERLPRPWTALALGRSRVLLAAASGQDTVPELAALSEVMAALPANVLPLDRARCLLVAGLAHRRARRKREAKDSLSAALEAFNALGARTFASRTEAELSRVGVRVTATLDLTATEQRVAELAAQGRTNRVIAELLFISPKTVEANLARVYRKLGIATRAELGSVMGQVRT